MLTYTFPTKASKQFRNLFERKFPTLISFDNDNVMLKQIEIMDEKRFYIIIVKHIREEIIQSLIQNSKVKSIIFL